MAATAKHQCPICKSASKAPAENSWFPFCSNRCKLVDLSKWLNNEYVIPGRELDESDLPPAGPDGQPLN